MGLSKMDSLIGNTMVIRRHFLKIPSSNTFKMYTVFLSDSLIVPDWIDDYFI